MSHRVAAPLICFALFALNRFFVGALVASTMFSWTVFLHAFAELVSLSADRTGRVVWIEIKISFCLSKHQCLLGSTPHRFRAMSARIYAHMEGWPFLKRSSITSGTTPAWKTSRQSKSARFRWWSEIKNCLFSCNAERICIIDRELYFCLHTTYVQVNSSREHPPGQTRAFDSRWVPVVGHLAFNSVPAPRAFANNKKPVVISDAAQSQGFQAVKHCYFGVGKEPLSTIKDQ